MVKFEYCLPTFKGRINPCGSRLKNEIRNYAICNEFLYVSRDKRSFTSHSHTLHVF